MRRVNQRTFAVLAALLVLIAVVFSTAFGTGISAFAAENVVAAFEAQNVYVDLQNSVIAGEKFDIEDYPYNGGIDPQVISFVEFGYSAHEEKQQDFGLYVYVYNPRETVFDPSGNSVLFSYGNAESDKYPLVFLNYCNASGYEGRFYKFRVGLTEIERKNILGEVRQNARVYSVAELELSAKGVVTAYACAQTYTYSGYSLGYGFDGAAESSLSCSVDGFEKYVELDVHHTAYRPEGDFYEGTQSQLNSCYFRVPEKYFTDYGDLTKIVAEWYEYLTKPILVTETNYLYQRLYSLHGENVKNFSSDAYFLIQSCSNYDSDWLGGKAYGLGWASNAEGYKDHYYFPFGNGVNDLIYDNMVSSGAGFDNFAAVYYADKGYRERSVSTSELEEQFLLNSEHLGAPYFGGLYSEALFTEYVNDGHIRGYNKKTIRKDDLKDTWWTVTWKDGWQTAFGGYNVETIYDSIKAIVTSSDPDFDLSGSDGEIAERLKISANDVTELKAEYAKAKANEERLVLLRFCESTYYSIPCVESYCSSSTDNVDTVLVKDFLQKWARGEYTAYIAQETVYLDFDIISLWFMADDGSETEIPVVMSPRDVFSPVDPPDEENYHNDQWKLLWGMIIAVIALVLLIVILSPILPYIVQGVVWLVTAPFKLIAAIVKAIKKKANKDKEK